MVQLADDGAKLAALSAQAIPQGTHGREQSGGFLPVSLLLALNEAEITIDARAYKSGHMLRNRIRVLSHQQIP